MNITPVNASGFPESLKALDRWVGWKLEKRPDSKGNLKDTKVPYNIRTGYEGSSTDPKTWGTFAAVLAAYEAGGYDGIGFVFNSDGIVGIDLDKCRNSETGEIQPWAQAIISAADSYTETSVSGTGVHIILRGGKLPPKGRRFGPIEVYEIGRYFTGTGNRIAGTPPEVNDRADILLALHTQFTLDYEVEKQIKKAAKFRALWQGDVGGYESQSQADLALCGYLARITRDTAQIDRLFRRSALYRDKWERQDYRDSTIAKALDSKGYQPGVLLKNGVPLVASPDALSFLATAPTSDAGNAECLELLYGEQFRYCHDRKKWLGWDGNRWKLDGDGAAERAALATVRFRRAAAAQIADPDQARKAFLWALGSESEGKRAAMLSTARILETFTTRVDLYDRDPMLAGTPNGVLDLRTGEHRAAKQDDYITSVLGAEYNPAATCPRWLQFLEEVFAGDAELIAYIQRAFGYTLSGDTREQKLFLCFGHGENGKSVFLDVFTCLLGEYAGNTSFDTFDAGRRNEATNDLAALKGKRLVTVIETEDDRRLAEARVKAVTGQDPITCRFLYGEFFTYRPQFKIWMAMNHKPNIRGTDHAIWRRVRLIPFTESFSGRADLTLRGKLLAELPGILNWALEGLKSWQRDGLGTAKAVDDATNKYRRDSDLVSQWKSECVTVDRSAVMSAKEAYESYRDWCKDRGERESTSRALGRRLSELGFKSEQYGPTRTMHYFGLRLGPPDPNDESNESNESVLGDSPLVNTSRVEVPVNGFYVSHNSQNGHTAPLVMILTSEWQEVPAGMAIPQGADIRMDMDSGKNFARLLPVRTVRCTCGGERRWDQKHAVWGTCNRCEVDQEVHAA